MCLQLEQRGPDVAFMCIYLVGGCAFAYWVDFGFTRMTNQVSWVGSIGSFNISQTADAITAFSYRLSGRLRDLFRRWHRHTP
jgi:hypothetical protein